ncbi:MAG: FKBP-type peptidyl-prolyl cis-trans isomerase [Patescibacteria group bacterium]|nr:FKBP-type peptidyl-prolyl cis-trans isomerase [Patescibacteria group bacterium]
MKKNMQIVVILIVIAIAIFVVLGFFGVGGLNLFGIASPQNAAPTTDAQTATTSGQSAAQTLLTQVEQAGSVSTLEGADITVGTGPAVQSGDTVTVNYIGALTNGTVFDASSAHGQPFTFTVGAGQVIKGWDEGLIGMQEGGMRLLAVPANLAYGANPPAGSHIPANATLLFQVQLVKIASSTAATPAAGTSGH